VRAIPHPKTGSRALRIDGYFRDAARRQSSASTPLSRAIFECAGARKALGLPLPWLLMD
jgi:hypothetical protein